MSRGYIGMYRVKGSPKFGVPCTSMMKNQIEKIKDDEIETGFVQVSIGIRVSQHWGYHFGLP